MSSHPRKPRDPENPAKNRHIVERSKTIKHDARGAQEIMERDALRVLNWLGEAPLRTITSDSMRSWVKSQTPPWTPGYWRAIRAMVQNQLAEQTAESGQDVRTRLLTLIERLIPECREVVLSGGDLVIDRRAPEYRRWQELKSVNDAWLQYDRRRQDYVEALNRQAQGGPMPGPAPTEPRWPRLSNREHDQMTELAKVLPYLTGINHTAAQGYLKLYAQLKGLMAEKHQHLHLHRAIEQGGDLSSVPEAELIAAMKITTTKEPANA
jgi:hypothetical protein